MDSIFGWSIQFMLLATLNSDQTQMKVFWCMSQTEHHINGRLINLMLCSLVFSVTQENKLIASEWNLKRHVFKSDISTSQWTQKISRHPTSVQLHKQTHMWHQSCGSLTHSSFFLLPVWKDWTFDLRSCVRGLRSGPVFRASHTLWTKHRSNQVRNSTESLQIGYVCGSSLN